jgi:hypothetical protein
MTLINITSQAHKFYCTTVGEETCQEKTRKTQTKTNNTQQYQYKNKQISTLQSPKSSTVHNITTKTIQYKLQQK